MNPSEATVPDDTLEALAEEIIDSVRRGEAPDEDRLSRQFPEHADMVGDYVRTLSMLEASSARHHGPTLCPDSDDPLSRRLGDFRLLRELGRGGMGIVYEAEQVSLNRKVAIKVLSQSPLFSEKSRIRFLREATAAARLHHTNIVPVFGVGEQDGVRYLVMQRIHGPGLDSVIPAVARRLGRLEGAEAALKREPAADAAALGLLTGCFENTSGQTQSRAAAAIDDPAGSDIPIDVSTYWKSVAKIGLQASEALAYAHEHNVLHRDLKPANFLLEEDGVLWLTDFGLAKLHDEGSLTETGDIVGTIRYSPPEYLRGNYEFRSDIYQLGLTLYEMLTLRPAVAASNRQQTVDRVLNHRPETPRRIWPAVPRDLETIVMKCLAFDVRNRYESAQSVAADLELYLEDRPITARRVRLPERLWRWCRRNPAIASLTGATVVLLTAIAIVSTTAYFREAKLRQEAEITTATALDSLDHVYEAFVPNWSLVGEAASSGSIRASPKVAQLLEELVEFYDRLTVHSQFGSQEEVRLDVARALRRTAQIYVRLGEFDRAKETYGRAVQRLAPLMKSDSRQEAVLIERSKIFNDLGIVYWSDREIQESYEAHLEALQPLEIRSAQGELDASTEWTVELARTLYLLARRGRGRFGGTHLRPVISLSEANFDLRTRTPQRPKRLDDAISLLQQVVHSTQNPDYSHLLAICYRERSNGKLDDAGNPLDPSIQQSIAILERLVETHPDHAGYQYSLCVAYQWYNIPTDQPEAVFEKAVQRTERAAAIAGELAQTYPQEWIFRAMLVELDLQTAKYLSRYGRFEEAEVHSRSAINRLTPLHETQRSHAYTYWLGHTYTILGDAQLGQGKTTEAIDAYQTGIAILDECVRRHPEGGHVIFGNMARAAKACTDPLLQLGRYLEADAACRIWQSCTAKKRAVMATGDAAGSSS